MPSSLNNAIYAYQKQIEAGLIQKAYQGLMSYVMALRTHLTNKYPDDFSSSHVYQGYMDFTYFPFTPNALKSKKLKIIIVLNHKKMHFEICLAGQNKQIQKNYWELIKNKGAHPYHLPPTPQDVIISHILVEHPDFDAPDALTVQIETKTMKFIQNVIKTLDS